MGSTLMMEAVRKHDDDTFEYLSEPRKQVFETLGGDMWQLSEYFDDGILKGPDLRWIREAGDADYDSERSLDACFEPAYILGQLDELERVLAAHGSKPPFFTKYWWTTDQGERRWSNSIHHATLDGEPCQLWGGWDGPIMVRPTLRPALQRTQITADKVMLETHKMGSVEIDVERQSLLDLYRPQFKLFRPVCQEAAAQGGLVYCLLVH